MYSNVTIKKYKLALLQLGHPVYKLCFCTLIRAQQRKLPGNHGNVHGTMNLLGDIYLRACKTVTDLVHHRLSPICECGTEQRNSQFNTFYWMSEAGIRSEFNNIENCLGKNFIYKVTKCFIFSPSLKQNIIKSGIVFIKEALFEYIFKTKSKT